MTKKILHHTLLSTCIIGIFAGCYAVTLGSGLQSSHSTYDYIRWKD